MNDCQKQSGRRLPVGAEICPGGGAGFRVWAPRQRNVAVVLQSGLRDDRHSVTVELARESAGYFSGVVERAQEGMLYGFRLDGDDKLAADPASRFQPAGAEGLSQVVDPQKFAWTDRRWLGIAPRGQVLYEMHVGTFTPQGTWAAALRELPRLAELGITVIQMMPVAEFSGRFGWGYDGVFLFAPTRLYGEPDDLRRFVDAAHATGIGVILDVVYNHFGPVGNPHVRFSNDFRSERYENEWADAINFDGPNSAPVRDFFVANARYWIDEFHFDGFRFDATQAIHDASSEHILAQIVRAARETAGGRQLLLTAENEPQDVSHVRPLAEGGFGLDALLNDDFHHATCARLTGKAQAYNSDYRGTSAEMIAALKWGFIYQGQRSRWQNQPRGTPTTGLAPEQFVNFLENHDQVANSATGERLHRLTSPGRYRAVTALWLLSPQTPLFFQGQEYASPTQFLYFADHDGKLRRDVAKGRREFLAQFPGLASPEAQQRLPAPGDVSVFERSKLRQETGDQNRACLALHKDLLHLRRRDQVFSDSRAARLDAAALSEDCFVVRWFGTGGIDRLLLCNFGIDLRYSPVAEPLLAPPAGCVWTMMWSSDDPKYGGHGTAPVETETGWLFPGEAAVVLRSTPAAGSSRSESDDSVKARTDHDGSR